MKYKILIFFFSAFLFTINCNSQVTKNNIGDKVYGDFNGDGKFEYAFRVLTKKGFGNPVEDGVPDEYELKFSDENIKPIKDNFYWFTLINEGDLDNDGSDEISVKEDPMNGCIGMVKTFTIKNEKSNYLFEPFSFYRSSCDNKMSINPQDLVEKDNGIVYFYEYNADADLEPNGGYSVNSNGEKIFGKKIKVFEVKPIENKKTNRVLKDILNSSKSENNKGGYILTGRKAVIKPLPEYKCNEEGIVVVEIVVDKSGNVLEAKTGLKGTTNRSKCLLDACKEAALKTKWEADENALDKQIGTINYIFKISK